MSEGLIEGRCWKALVICDYGLTMTTTATTDYFAQRWVGREGNTERTVLNCDCNTDLDFCDCDTLRILILRVARWEVVTIPLDSKLKALPSNHRVA